MVLKYGVLMFCYYLLKKKKKKEPEAQGRKKRRNRSGTVALREIRHFQRSCELLIPAAPFIRCVSFSATINILLSSEN